MGDPSLRKSSALRRLRNQLKKKKESLADHFDFKMYITFHFKEKVNKILSIDPCMFNSVKNHTFLLVNYYNQIYDLSMF